MSPTELTSGCHLPLIDITLFLVEGLFFSFWFKMRGLNFFVPFSVSLLSTSVSAEATTYLLDRLESVYLYNPIYDSTSGTCSCVQANLTSLSDVVKEHYKDLERPQLHLDVFSTEQACLQSYAQEIYHYCTYQGQGRSIARKLWLLTSHTGYTLVVLQRFPVCLLVPSRPNPTGTAVCCTMRCYRTQRNSQVSMRSVSSTLTPRWQF